MFVQMLTVGKHLLEALFEGVAALPELFCRSNNCCGRRNLLNQEAPGSSERAGADAGMEIYYTGSSNTFCPFQSELLPEFCVRLMCASVSLVF